MGGSYGLDLGVAHISSARTSHMAPPAARAAGTVFREREQREERVTGTRYWRAVIGD